MMKIPVDFKTLSEESQKETRKVAELLMPLLDYISGIVKENLELKGINPYAEEEKADD